MPRLGFITDPDHVAHDYSGHVENAGRLSAITRHLEEHGLIERMVTLPLRNATDDEILAVHDQLVVDTIQRYVDAGGGWIDPDTYVVPRSAWLARRAAGAALAGVEAVLGGEVDRVFVAIRPPGHHATRHHSMGFCLLNNISIAAAKALEMGVQRLAIVDWDVHHGNGTQDIFEPDPRVLYLSTHAAPFYPGTGTYNEVGSGPGRGTKVNIPLPHGTGDAGFLQAYEQVVIPALDRFQPELVLVSCGWDSHVRDPLGTLAVSTATYTAVARLVRDAAARHARGRVVVVLEGGYDPHALAWCAQGLCEVLLDVEPTPDPQPVSGVPAGPDVALLITALRDLHGLR